MTRSDYVLPSSAAEAERLERQADLYGGLAFLEPFLGEAPARVLDVGCGTGAFTRRVAALLPDSQVTGLDQDAARLAFARRQGGRPNLDYAEGDLAALPFEDGRFDLAFCRFVLVHVADPGGALREMARVTRPGGRVVAYDMVHDGVWFSPPRPAFARLLGAALAVMRERGMEPSQGLHLASGMTRAGLADVGARVIPHLALAGEPRFERYRQNWLETVSGLAEILGAHFDPGLVEAARAELDRVDAGDTIIEITVVAHGRRR